MFLIDKYTASMNLTYMIVFVKITVLKKSNILLAKGI